MAGIADRLIAAEHVIATGVETAVAAAVARPTKPPKVSLKQLTEPETQSALAAGRTHASVTVIGNKAIIFGGEEGDRTLCSPDVHVVSLPTSNDNAAAVEYRTYPAVPLKDSTTGQTSPVPQPRGRAAACAWGKSVIINGGYGSDGFPLSADDEATTLWIWDSEQASWSRIYGATQLGKPFTPRYGHWIFVDEEQGFLLLHGGRTHPDKKTVPALPETWLISFEDRAWTVMPDAPAPPLAAAYVDRTLYTISRGEGAAGAVHYLRVGASAREREYPGALVWQTVKFPADPEVPAPEPRVAGALIPVDVGMGRKFLLHVFGKRPGRWVGEKEAKFLGDVWALQLPTHGPTAAAVKDAVNGKIPGKESGELSWSEVEIVPREENQVEGNVHAGSRSCFGASVCLDGKGVFIWGGVDETSQKQANGWVLKVV